MTTTGYHVSSQALDAAALRRGGIGNAAGPSVLGLWLVSSIQA